MFEKLTFFYATKTLRYLQSALYLTQLGHPQEAGTLARVLFNLLVDFAYMRRNKKRLSDRFVTHRFSRELDHLKILREYSPEIIKKYTKETIEKIEWNAQIFSEAYDPEKKTKRFGWSGISIKERAKLTGLGKAYAFYYTLACDEEHSNVISADDYVKPTTDGIKLEVEPKKEVEVEIGAAIDFSLVIFQIFCEEHKLNTKNIQQLREELIKIGGEN